MQASSLLRRALFSIYGFIYTQINKMERSVAEVFQWLVELGFQDYWKTFEGIKKINSSFKTCWR